MQEKTKWQRGSSSIHESVTNTRVGLPTLETHSHRFGVNGDTAASSVQLNEVNILVMLELCNILWSVAIQLLLTTRYCTIHMTILCIHVCEQTNSNITN